MEELLFGDIVVVEENLIGVIVKCWVSNLLTNPTKKYEVYVREYNRIKEYEWKDVKRYKVRHKYLTEEELQYQNS